ncbi:protein phosphatase [Planifilum fulgidum]|jgi:serine/threonine protein phosphatase PrpC|uniref:protein-serine/threonine phosphatase n=1 Tax=Planifilum fulgidum TaxID=201973 RepID=A0A1I2R2Y0_9BACL|nr:Stp1/IreP family PP2C-type Ser/Thr phosphatase [Planifilum fulgidum]MBO2496809.1 serine/threonine-protein phosphatase [Bacillota bacterium]SFG35034.1 protein phosphatase [Planifilum fulgidum]
METAWRTDKGKVRPHNEDAVELFRTDFGSLVAVVADGMGGHRSGEVASRQAVQVIRRELRSLSPDASTEEQKKRLLDAVVKANAEVHQLASGNEEYRGMGTTVIAAVVSESEVVLAHIGDSRAYILHDGGLYQLTEDHSLVNMLLKHGQITEEEARTHPHRNMIVKALGTNTEVEADIIVTPWEKEDILLICSDGLTGMVEERDIGLVLTSDVSLSEQADKLIRLALDAGGTDNISLILIKNAGGTTPSS